MIRILGGIFAVAAFAANAGAADLPTKAPRYVPPAPVANWTGCYVAGGGGYKMWSADRNLVDGTTGAVSVLDGTSSGRGWLARGQIGCDYQFNNSSVLGVFADYDWTNAHGDYFQRVGGTITANTVGDRKESSAWAVGGRLGYLVTPSVLTYISGGYTEARFDAVNLLFAAGTGFIGTTAGLGIGGQTFRGAFLGSGFEYSAPFFPGLALKTEYRFSWYNSGDSTLSCTALVTGACGFIGPTSFVDRATTYQQSVTTSLVYRFGAGLGGVTARY